MRRAIGALLILALPWIVAGCTANSNHSTTSAPTKEAVRCAKNWRKQGFNFHPNAMTPTEMFDRVQAIRRAAYWRERGYGIDPNGMTVKEIDAKVEDIQRAEYWHQQSGFTFDPKTMTAAGMDKKASELQTAACWEQMGYYYDPNSQKVYLDKSMTTELSSLTTIHESRPAVPSVYAYQAPTDPAASEWRLAETTRINGRVRRVKRGTLLRTISGHLYEVIDSVLLMAMEPRPEVTVLRDGNSYKLLIEGLDQSLLCKRHEVVTEAHIQKTYVDSPFAGDPSMFSGLNHGNIYQLDNGEVWVQTEFCIETHIAVRPDVIIYGDRSTYRMKVESVDNTVEVRRLK